MGRRYDGLEKEHINFIMQQKFFFFGIAANDGTINFSPKGWESLRVLSTDHIAWLNITGSEHKTATHLAQNERETINTSEAIGMRNSEAM